MTLGAQSYDSFSSRSGFSAANILIYQLPGSNALDVARQHPDTPLKSSALLEEQLAQASPDLLRELLQIFINGLILEAVAGPSA